MRIPIEDVEEAEFQMSPMIDVVFQLLIFFMCASHFSTMEKVELEIPVANRAVVPRERPHRFIVNIQADGTLYGSFIQVNSINELKEMVKAKKVETPDLKIYLRADQRTEHVHVKKVMAAMAELGIDDFIFGAFIPGEEFEKR